MRTLSSGDFLDLWERGSQLHPLDQGLLALSAALTDTPNESPADWPLGRRNRALAELRFSCFGSELQGWLACPKCAERLEFQMDGRTILSSEGEPDSGQLVVVNGRSFRLPTSRDVARAARETEPRMAAVRLLESCHLDEGAAPSWTDDELEQIGERLALADPMAETSLAFHCPKCGNDWEELLDTGAFLWSEIEARARRLLLEIHALATAYGWTQGEILALGDRRRATYLDMVRG
jgi:hypothetical protein